MQTENFNQFFDSLGDVMSCNKNAVIYSINGSQDEVAKEIQLDGLDESAIASLRDFTQLLMRLQHPNILACTCLFEHENCLYLRVARYSHALDALLREYKRDKKTLPPDLIIHFIKQIAGALAYLHRKEKMDNSSNPLPAVVHGGIKPTNLLIDKKTATIVLSDTGISKSLGGMTPVYTAPEVLKGEQPTPASDMWSLGVVLYEMATGTRPAFLGGRDPRDVFISSWKPDLTAVTDSAIKNAIGKLLVPDTRMRLSAENLPSVLDGNISSSSSNKGDNNEVVSQGDLKRMQVIEGELAFLRGELTVMLETHKALQQKCIDMERWFENMEKNSRFNSHVESIQGTLQANFKKPERTVTENDDIEDLRTRISMLHKVQTNVTSKQQESIMDLQNRVDVLEQVCSIKNKMVRNTSIKRVAPRPPSSTRAKSPNSTTGFNIFEMSELMQAARDNNVQTLRYLIRTKADIKARDHNKMTALMHAVAYGSVDAVKILAEHEARLKNSEGKTALMMAAGKGEVEMVSALLSFENRMKDSSGQTAMMIAAQHGHAGVVAVLVKVESKMLDNRERTALSFAAESGNAEIVKILASSEARLKNAEEKTYMMIAASSNNVHAVKVLLEYEKGAQDCNGETALMHAAKKGHVGVVNLLVEHENGLRDNEGRTALYHAKSNGQKAVVDILFAYVTER